jgi:hypothetical protein
MNFHLIYVKFYRGSWSCKPSMTSTTKCVIYTARFVIWPTKDK